MARGFLFSDEKKGAENLLTMEDIPPDSLVDPRGKLVADVRMQIRR